MKIERKIGFFLEKRRDAHGNVKPDALVKMRVRYPMGIIDLSVGHKAEASKWLIAVQRCKAGTTHGTEKVSASDINTEIGRLEVLAQDVFKAYEVEGIVPSIDNFKCAFNLANGKEVAPEAVTATEQTFFTLFDVFTQENGRLNDWSVATYEKFSAMKNHMQEFNRALTFEDFTEEGLLDYLNFLRDNKGMRNTTLTKQLGFLKWFLRWATAKGYCKNNSYLTFKPKLKTSKKVVVFLNWGELMDLYNFEIPATKQYLERVRDVFCFCCFTSLRYSDAFNLKRGNIKGEIMEITTIKTADKLIIELNDYAKAILAKYKDVPFLKDKALPVISNQIIT